MTKVFVVAAICWGIIFGVFAAFDPHVLLAHWFTMLWVTALLSGLPFAWRWLEQYRYTASIAARVDAAEGQVWAKVLLLLEGIKTTILLFLASAFATAKDWVDSVAHTLLGLAPTDLDPFKDSTLLHAFFSDGVAMKAMAGLTFFAAFLALKGHLTAAKVTPAAATTPAS